MGICAEGWHGQVSGHDVVQSRDIRRSLNRGMTAQRENSSARTSNVPQKQLQNRGRTDDLHAFRMLRPTDRVADSGSLLRTRSGCERLCRFYKYVPRYSAEALDQF